MSPSEPEGLPAAMTSIPEPIDWREGLPILRGPGVTLREPRRADAGSLHAMLATDVVARYMSMPPDTADAFERFIVWIQEEREAGRFFCYGIVPEGQEHAVGLIQVRELDPGFGTAEWGFAIGRTYWGTGLFVAAARMVVDFVFRHVGVHRLEARACTENGRGNGALRKLHAACEGELRQSLPGTTHRRNQFLWSLLDEEWLPAHPTPAYARLETVTSSPESVEAPPRTGPPTDIPSWRIQLPHLRGTSCTLRELNVPDAAPLHALIADERVHRYMASPPSTVEGFEQFIAWARNQRAAGRFVCYGVVPHGAAFPVGLIQLRQLEAGFKTAEWGFVLGMPFWGRGVFIDGAEQVLDWAFADLGVHRIEARAALANRRANGALRKLRHVCEGRLRSSFLLSGEYLDDALWALLADEWRAWRRGGDRLFSPHERSA